MRNVIVGVLAMVFVFLAGGVRAEEIAVPAAINYQGMLTNPSDGAPVQAGVYHLEFRVWSDPTDTDEANLIWGRVFPVHVMSNGVFNILLTDDGTAVTAPSAQTNDLKQAFQGENRYLGLTITHGPTGVINSPEISPRQRMVSAPFAFHSQNSTDAYHAEEADEAVLAQNSEKLGGRLANDYYDKDNSIISHHEIKMEDSLIVPAEGSTKGIQFPTNIGGGGGDKAGLEYFVAENSEDCELRLFVDNDSEDKIRIEASGNIEINAGQALVLKNADMVEVIGARSYAAYNMDKWYKATGDGMVTFHGYKGRMRYYHKDAAGNWITYSSGWANYFTDAGSDTLSFSMPVATGDRIYFSPDGSWPSDWRIVWSPFGAGQLVEE